VCVCGSVSQNAGVVVMTDGFLHEAEHHCKDDIFSCLCNTAPADEFAYSIASMLHRIYAQLHCFVRIRVVAGK